MEKDELSSHSNKEALQVQFVILQHSFLRIQVFGLIKMIYWEMRGI